MLDKLIQDAQRKGLISIQKTKLSELPEAARIRQRAFEILTDFARTSRPATPFTYTRATEQLESVDFGNN